MGVSGCEVDEERDVAAEVGWELSACPDAVESVWIWVWVCDCDWKMHERSEGDLALVGESDFVGDWDCA